MLPTYTPFPSPVPATPIPTPQDILSESTLPPGAVARIPPLTDPDLSEASGKYSVINDQHGFRVFENETGTMLWAKTVGETASAVESPDERWIVANVRGRIYVWDIGSGKLHASLIVEGERADFFRWASDGQTMAVVFAPDGHDFEPGTGDIKLWNPREDRVLYSITDQKYEIGHILWIQDSRLLVTSNYAHG